MNIEVLFIALAAFLSIILILVVAHEFAHYLAARIFGIIPQSFSVGMGPEIAAYTDKSGTRWKLSALPIGGYVKFRGDMHPVSGENQTNGDFADLKRWKRSIIVAAGPLTNLVIAGLIFLGTAFAFGYNDVTPQIKSVDINSPAEKAGLQAGDTVKSWGTDKNPNIRNLIRSTLINTDEKIELKVSRGGQNLNAKINVIPKKITDNDNNSAVVGYSGLNFTIEKKRIRSLKEVVDIGIVETANLLILQAKATYQIITGKRDLSDLTGPVRMAKISGEQAQLGWRHLIYFAGIVSIAIGFMNLLPIPGLDGGYLALYAFESIRQKNIDEKTLKGMMIAGYVIIGIITGVAIMNDAKILLVD